MNYLNSGLQGLANIELRVLSQPEMRAALLHNELNLIFTNPSHFIELRTLNQLSGALATLTRLENNQPVSELGGVIIRRADRPELQTLHDLQTVRIAAVGTQFLGGYATQMIELKKAGRDRYAVYQPDQPG
ncbi:PhnD/SsuA/transferrin family substrate-binding protein [Venatoribacter cucullus]|uniref:PhnD/SsuA/transferrin family substrate-binding protein n=1 Tax=Venatoribacter cucullus TaxID=2661630 RepID=UPI002240B8E7|nr:PhnD/SsuA/transferrin family substrate-binding protein [Venatoribacter cucullus]